jgi:invasion protein IalB
MAAIETISRRDVRPGTGTQADNLSPFLQKPTTGDSASSRGAPPDNAAPAQRATLPQSQRANGKALFSWRPSQGPCSERQLVDMAAQITAAYVASHSVTAGMTAKYVREVYEVLAELADQPVPAEPRWSLVRKLTIASSLVLLIGLASLGLITDFGGRTGNGGQTQPAPVTTGEEETSSATRSLTPLSGRLQHAASDTRSVVSTAVSAPLRFEDWDVTCSAGKCSFAQQSQHGDGSATARISLQPGPEAGSLTGTMTLPFEVPLQSRITLQTGAGALDGPLSFRSCGPQGCILPISLNAAQVASLQKGILLQANATSDEGRTLSFLFSLKGFRAAYERVRRTNTTEASAP